VDLKEIVSDNRKNLIIGISFQLPEILGSRQMNSVDEPVANLPINLNLKFAYLFTLIIAAIMTIASVDGIINQSTIYPTEELQRTFMPNDVVNLIIGVPILLGSLWLTHREKLIGLLFWPGALLYVLYNYVAYLFGIPFNVLSLLYLSLITMSAYTIIGIVASINGRVVQQRLTGRVPERLAGGVTAGFGLLFMLRVVAIMVLAFFNQTSVESTEIAVMIADFIVGPAMIIGGILLWRHEALGYVSGLGLLFQTSMLFIGLIIFMMLQPLITSAPFILIDVIVVFIMGLVCFIPFGLFIRGVIATRDSY
jgi:hypothetical protein